MAIGACLRPRLPFGVLAAVAVLAPAITLLGRQNLPGLVAVAAGAIALFRRDLVWRLIRANVAAVAALDAFLALGFVTLIWTVDRERTLVVAAGNLAIVTAGPVLCAAALGLTCDEAARIARLAAWSVVGAIAFMAVMHFTDLWPLRLLRSLLGQDPPRTTFLKAPAIDLALLLPLAMHFAAPESRFRPRAVRFFAVLAIVGAFLAVSSAIGSRAALLAAAAGAAGVLLYRFWPRAALWGVVAWIGLVIPFAPPLARHLLPLPPVAAVFARLGPSAEHRRIIWLHAMDLAQKRPLLGYGLGSSRSIPEGQRYLLLDPSIAHDGINAGYPIQLLPVHPHNFSIEILLELGVAGIALVGLAYLMIVLPMAASREPRLQWGPAVGLLAAIFSVQNVSFSAWNASFLAMIAVAAAMALVAARTGEVRPRG